MNKAIFNLRVKKINGKEITLCKPLNENAVLEALRKDKNSNYIHAENYPSNNGYIIS